MGFNEECDRLSRVIAPKEFEAAEFARTGGQLLDTAAGVSKRVFDERFDFFFQDLPASDPKSRHLLLSNRLAGNVGVAELAIHLVGDDLHFDFQFPRRLRFKSDGADLSRQVPKAELSTEALQNYFSGVISTIEKRS